MLFVSFAWEGYYKNDKKMKMDTSDDTPPFLCLMANIMLSFIGGLRMELLDHQGLKESPQHKRRMIQRIVNSIELSY